MLLFRFSALTGNSHRIHYDADYARDVEGYSDVVVHGPLLALLMCESLSHSEHVRVNEISYRLHSPAFVNEDLQIEGHSLATDDGPTDGTTYRLHVNTGRRSRHASAELRVQRRVAE